MNTTFLELQSMRRFIILVSPLELNVYTEVSPSFMQLHGKQLLPQLKVEVFVNDK